MKNEEVIIGDVRVDSGQLLVCDPCYIDSQWIHNTGPQGHDPNEKSHEFSYRGACNRSLSKDANKQLVFSTGFDGAGVAFRTRYGDGVYPVFAEFDGEGLIVKVWIEF